MPHILPFEGQRAGKAADSLRVRGKPVFSAWQLQGRKALGMAGTDDRSISVPGAGHPQSFGEEPLVMGPRWMFPTIFIWFVLDIHPAKSYTDARIGVHRVRSDRKARA